MQEIPTVQQPAQVPQQPIYQQQPPMYPPPTYQPPQQPPPSRKRLWLTIGIVVAVLLVGGFIIGAIAGTLGLVTTTPSATQPTQQVTMQPVPTQAPTEVPQPTPTVAPLPTQSPAQIEKAFKSNVMATTIATLDKQGNAYRGQNVYFTCTLSNFVKDSNGYTAGANVTDPNTSGVVQVLFPTGTDLSKLNTGDTLEVWGIDAGMFSGKNAFGATVQEVGVIAKYMTDQTTGYATH